MTPLETIVDVIAEVNRATPGAGGPMDAVDHEEVLRQTRLFMVDERHGLRRLESVLRQRKCFPEMGTPCTAIGTNMESRGLCYPQAICTCIDEGSGPAWRCLRP